MNEEASVADHSVQEEDAELRNPNFIRGFHDWEGIKKVLSLTHHIPTENVFGRPGCPTMVANCKQ